MNIGNKLKFYVTPFLKLPSLIEFHRLVEHQELWPKKLGIKSWFCHYMIITNHLHSVLLPFLICEKDLDGMVLKSVAQKFNYKILWNPDFQIGKNCWFHFLPFSCNNKLLEFSVRHTDSRIKTISSLICNEEWKGKCHLGLLGSYL